MLTTMIANFHRKINAAIGVELLPGLSHQAQLEDLIERMTVLSKKYESSKDINDQRAHLKLEECSEFLLALLEGHRRMLLDAICDDVYVTAGTAVTFGLPFEQAFIEVHRSNMSKEPQASDPNRHRVRDKGPNYSPPDLDRILEEYATWKP